MITKEQALTAQRFHAREGQSCILWRRNGRTQTWVTRPAEFRVPVKHGLYRYGQLTELEAQHFHTEDDCPDKQ